MSHPGKSSPALLWRRKKLLTPSLHPLPPDAKVLLDGRSANGAPIDGNLFKPTALDNLPPTARFPTTEIFGPVLSLVHANTLEEGIETLSRSRFGNMASIFTSCRAAARKFRYEVPAGNIGVKIGVAAPMAYFPFSGWRDSSQTYSTGKDAMQFYTDKKVVVERWPKEWSREFCTRHRGMPPASYAE